MPQKNFVSFDLYFNQRIQNSNGWQWTPLLKPNTFDWENLDWPADPNYTFDWTVAGRPDSRKTGAHGTDRAYGGERS